MFSWKKKAYELKQKRAAALQEAETAFEAGNTELVEAKQAEVETLNGQIETAMKMAEESAKDFGIKDYEPDDGKEFRPKKSTKAFANAIKSMILGKTMNEGTGENGGYTVPEDIETQIREYRNASADLSDLVTTETTNTASGSRVYRSRTTSTGFAEVGEGVKAAKKDGPKFERILWAVKKFMGVLPVTNELLEDSDADIEAQVVQWGGEEFRATKNKQILAVLQAKAATVISGIAGIKTALNVTLGSAFKAVSVILTNDSGLDYLDQLVDNNNRPLLNPDPTDSAKLQLRAGTSVVPIVVVPDAELGNVDGKIPFIIGSLKDAVLLKLRKGLTILPTKEGAISDLNAFEQDLTLFRFIARLCAVKVDENAWVYALLDTGASAAAASEEPEGAGE